MTLDRLYRDVENLKRQYKGLAGGPQLALSSIENGAIDSMDADGNLKMTIGQQDDGGNTVNVISGPTPPTPVGFTVDVDHGKFIVHWSGDFDGDALAPSDWSRAEVHASPDPFFVPDRTTARGSIVSAAGGEVTIGVLKGPWTIKMLAWSQAGKMSAPSAPVDVEVPGYGEIVLEEIDAAETVIKNANDILVEGQETLGGKLTDAFGQIVDAKTVAERAETAANDAAQDASEAQSAADQAAQDALGAVGIANGKGKIIVQVSKPTGANANVNNLWIDISGTSPKNQPNRYNGTDWVPVTDKTATDAAAAAVAARSKADEAKTAADNAKAAADAAKAAADNAQTTASQALASANGKNVVHYENRRPTSSDPGVEGDTWFVGQVGRPNDVIEATNLATNPSFEGGVSGWTQSNATAPLTSSATFVERMSGSVGSSNGLLTIASGHASPYASARIGDTEKIPATPGTWVAVRAWAATEQTGEQLRVQVRVGASSEGYDYFATSFSTAGFYTGRTMLVSFQVPAGKTEFRPEVQLYSGSPSVNLQAGKRMWIDGVNIVSAGSEEKARSLAGGYFDGDTPPGATDNESHYRWTGTPHASTSEKYLPATEGLSDKWNVTEQYRFESGAWVQVELSHTVLSSLDLGKLVVGSAAIKEAVIERLWADVVVQRMSIAEEFIGENAILTGAVTAPKITASEELWAKLAQFVKIRAEHIESDALDSMVITSPTIQSARSGRRWVANQDSIRVIDENDDVRTQLSPEGSTFKGEVEADTLVVNEGAEFKANNTLAQGATLTLAAGVTDPTAPPIVQPFWDGLEFEPVFMNGSDPVGLAWDGTNYITVGANKGNSGVSSFYRGVYAMKINGTTGASAQFRCDFSAASDSESRVSEVFGVTCIGSELFWLGRYGYNGYVWVTDLDGVFKRRFASPDIGYSATNPLTYRPGIGNDGTNLVIAQCTDTGSLGWGFISKTNGAVRAGGLDRGDATKSDITGVYVGNGDWGTKYVVVAKKSTNTVQVFSTNGSATNHSWYTENGDVGIVFHDGTFHTLNSDGIVHEYTDTNTGDNSGDWWAAYRWTADTTPEDEYITHWSRIGPPKRFTWPRRAQLRIIGQPLPVGVDFIGPSLAKKTTTPTRTDFHSPSWWPRVGTEVAWYDTLPTDWETAATPRDENNFPGGTPSTLKSANNMFEANGDGTGRWGPITWHSNGTIQGATAAGEVIVPINAANSNRTLAVTFTTGRFKTPPTVVATPVTPDPQTSQVSVSNITATGFTMVARRTVASDAYVRWVATEG